MKRGEMGGRCRLTVVDEESGLELGFLYFVSLGEGKVDAGYGHGWDGMG